MKKDLRLLIIDDNQEIHRDFLKILTSSPSNDKLDLLDKELFGVDNSSQVSLLPHFEIDTVSQGQEGFERIKSAIEEGWPYSLAFVDIRMPPGWDGVETIKHIWEVDKDIQIVICTAYSDYSWEETVAELGSTDNLLILKKPFDNVSVRQLAYALTKKWQLLKESKSYTHSLEQRIEERTESLQHSLSLIRSTLESSADGILVVDNHGAIMDYNTNFATLWQLPQAILDAKEFGIILEYVLPQLKETEGFLAKIKHLSENRDHTFLDLIKFKDGRVYEQYSQPHKLDDKTVGRVWSFRDVTQRVALESKLEYQAMHDSLTGLPNRVLLMDRINYAIEYSKRNHSLFGILFFDLDRFKLINDSLTHATGDELLQAVAKRVQGVIRSVDTFARMGGDEFVIVLPDLGTREAINGIAKKILSVFQEPFNLSGRTISITASIGVCVYPDDGKDSADLLSNADLAMYLAKEKGSNQYQVYTKNLSQRAHKRLEQEEDLRRAIDNKEFFLVYQPQLNVSTNTITAVEALLRWNHPTKGIVLPMDFIPIAEETGLIVPMGEWVIKEACQQHKIWQSRGLPPIRMIVNIESQLLKKPDLLHVIQNILKETQIDPEFLEFELTETVIVNNVDIITTIMDIKNLGVKFALDDFGTGNSSINYLKKLPLDKLKIDKSFIDDIALKGSDEVIIKAIIAMANSLNLDVLAEGVENQEQLHFLKNYNCDNIQGFYYSKRGGPQVLDSLAAELSYSHVY